jgi:DNA-binding Lrp family transcriptional regulator
MTSRLNESDQALVRFLQEDIPMTANPFADIAAQLGMSEQEVVDAVKAWVEDGTIRRFGAMVRHQRLGYKANAMSAWDIPDERIEEVGEALADAREVSHCYHRPRAEGWDYNIFAMIHAATEEECSEIAASLADRVGIDAYSLLFSSREFKKVSMKYFIE